VAGRVPVSPAETKVRRVLLLLLLVLLLVLLRWVLVLVVCGDMVRGGEWEGRGGGFAFFSSGSSCL